MFLNQALLLVSSQEDRGTDGVSGPPTRKVLADSLATLKSRCSPRLGTPRPSSSLLGPGLSQESILCSPRFGLVAVPVSQRPSCLEAAGFRLGRPSVVGCGRPGGRRLPPSPWKTHSEGPLHGSQTVPRPSGPKQPAAVICPIPRCCSGLRLPACLSDKPPCILGSGFLSGKSLRPVPTDGPSGIALLQTRTWENLSRRVLVHVLAASMRQAGKDPQKPRALLWGSLVGHFLSPGTIPRTTEQGSPHLPSR